MKLGIGLGLSPETAIGFRRRPSLILDFISNVYSSSGTSKAFGDVFTFTRASTGTRINASGVMETIAANQPRFDYDPVTLAPKGILIEEQRTNRVINSQTVPLGANAGGGSIVTVTDMGGGVSQIAKTGTGSFAEAVSACDMGGNIGDSFTVSNSCWVRIVSGSAADIQFGVGQNMSPYATLRDSLSSLGVVADGNWYAVKNTKTMSTIGDRNLRLASFGFNLATAATIQVKYIQGEIGAFASSHIPTAGSQVTRAADMCSINTLSPWFKASEGTLFAEFDGLSNSAKVVEFNPVSAGSFLALANSNSSNNGWYSSGIPVTGIKPLGLVNKSAIAYASAGVAAIGINGGVVSSSSGSDFTGASTSLALGNQSGGSFLNGHLRRVRYFPRRLTDLQLQALTA